MKCPHCSAVVPTGAEECPACGLIFAKLLKKRQRETEIPPLDAAAPVEPFANAAPKPAAWDAKTRGRVLAVVIVIAWIGLLAAYTRHSMMKRRARYGVMSDSDIPKTVTFQDPVTGEFREAPIKDSAGLSSRPPVAPKAQRPPDRWESSWVEEAPKK